MPVDSKVQYAAIVSIRNLEVDMRLRLSQLFTVLNVSFMAAAGTLIVNERLRVVLLFLSAGGVLSCVVWLLLVIRTTRWMQFWHSKLKKLEELNEVLIYTFDDEYIKTRQQGPPIYATVGILIVSFMIGWIITAILVAWRYMR